MSLDSIKRRREERLRRLREEMRQRTFDEDDEIEPSLEQRSLMKRNQDFWDDESTEQEGSVNRQDSSFVIKMVISLFLISFTYVMYNVDLPFSNQGRQFIAEVMSRDFNFHGVVAEVENRFGVHPSILPVFNTGNLSSQAVWSTSTKDEDYLSPVKGEITAPFILDGKGIQILSQEKEVKAIGEGWVTFVGQREDLGNTLIIQHENGTTSWYAGIEEFLVSQQDWVQPGQRIAHVEPGGSLYFSMQSKGQYVDPTSVITFE